METEKIYTQHEENTEWQNNLSFYKDELKIMQNRLNEIASKNSSKDVLAKVDHFQNQLIIQKEQIDIIGHSINLSNDAINAAVKRNTTAVDHRTLPDHVVVRDNMKTFETIFTSLKKELNTLLSQWM